MYFLDGCAHTTFFLFFFGHNNHLCCVINTLCSTLFLISASLILLLTGTAKMVSKTSFWVLNFFSKDRHKNRHCRSTPRKKQPNGIFLKRTQWRSLKGFKQKRKKKNEFVYKVELFRFSFSFRAFNFLPDFFSFHFQVPAVICQATHKNSNSFV